jgi:RHS repeat-associated protein
MRCWLSLLALLLATFAFGYEPKPGAALPDSILSVFNRSHADSESNAIPYRYNPFGNLISRTGDTPNNYLYCGEQYDEDLGLYYNRARYLNTDSGRFWTRDKWVGAAFDPPSLHKYLYAYGNPINNVDPTGRMTIIESAILGAVVNILGALGSPNFFNQTPEQMLKDLGISVVSGAAFGALGGPVGKLYVRMFGRQLSSFVLGAITGASVSGTSTLFEEILDIIINKKKVTGTVVICGATRTFVATVAGFTIGGLTAHVQTTHIEHARSVYIEYHGLPLPLTVFPRQLNLSGVAAIGAGDLLNILISEWLAFLAGCN